MITNIKHIKRMIFFTEKRLTILKSNRYQIILKSQRMKNNITLNPQVNVNNNVEKSVKLML